MKDLTDKQYQVLHHLHSYTTQNGYPPTLREIGREFGISSLRGVTVHLDALQRKGYLNRSSLTRSITLTDLGKQMVGADTAPESGGSLLSALQTEMLAALETQEQAWRHWVGNGDTRCEECNREDGLPCEAQVALEFQAHQLRRNVLAKAKAITAQESTR